jgi:hypothetical protein
MSINTEEKPPITINSDNNGNVDLTLSSTNNSAIKIGYKAANKLADRMKVAATDAELDARPILSWCSGAVLAAVVLFGVLMGTLFATDTQIIQGVLVNETGVTTLFMVISILSLWASIYRPAIGKALCAFGIVGTGVVGLYAIHSEQAAQQELADRLFKLQYCEGEDYVSAIKRNELPDCTPQWMKDHALKIVRTID